MGAGNDGIDVDIEDNDAVGVGQDESNDTERRVQNLSLIFFRSRLIEHFDILWSRNNIFGLNVFGFLNSSLVIY